jgi:hypothetical protein
MYLKAKLRGVVVIIAVLGLAALFGWSDSTSNTILTIIFSIGFIFFIIAVIRKLTGNG